jgi:lysine 2,3-aminomutase
MIKHEMFTESISTLEQLKSCLNLSSTEEEQLERVVQAHPMRISPHYLSLIDWNDPRDPIRKMAVPSCDELNLEGYYDTSGEAENAKMPGLQHKYSETALILATNRCATYCRHCFRKRLVGLPTEETLKRFEDAAGYIEKHTEINNVLVSGGDPLVLSNEVIKRFLEVLTNINHLNFIRFGSRVPVTFPSRLKDQKLLDIFKQYSKSDKRLYIVTQFNHPKEVNPPSISAVSNLLKAGVLLSNQTVLLKGVNNNPDTLANLMNKLVSIGVTPYYVFQCRPLERVKHHFQIPICEGVRIVERAKARCNGLSKRFKYVMSHKTGKIEIIGIMNGEIYFKYHEAKNRENLGVMFKRQVDEKAGWLDDFNSCADLIRGETTSKAEFSIVERSQPELAISGQN